MPFANRLPTSGAVRRRPGVVSLALLMTALLPLVSGPARADAVVIRSTAPEFKAGQMIASGTAITLPAGAAVTVVGQDGKTVVLTGPFSGPIANDAKSGDTHAVTALSRLLTASAADASALGVTRAAPGIASKDPYAIAAVAGNHCQVSDRKPTLKRGMALDDAHVTITSAKGEQAIVDWPAGTVEAEWPANLDLRDKATFQILVNTESRPVTITVHLVPAGLAPDALIAAWMADHGCGRQAHNLLATLK